MNKNRLRYYVFKKSPSVIDLINDQESNSEAQMACEIIAAHEGAIEESEDYWAYGAEDPALKPMMAWHELSKSRFYSVELTERMCTLWIDEILPHMQSESGVMSSELYGDIASYLNDAAEIIKERGDRCLLNFIGLDLSYRLRSALDEYLEDCCNDVYDVFTNAFNLKVYH